MAFFVDEGFAPFTLRATIEFDIGERTCGCGPPCQELDYEKLVLDGAGDGACCCSLVLVLVGAGACWYLLMMVLAGACAGNGACW